MCSSISMYLMILPMEIILFHLGQEIEQIEYSLCNINIWKNLMNKYPRLTAT